MTKLERAYQRIPQLEGENAALREENAALRDEVAMLKDKLASTQAQLELLIRHVFGKKSETTPPGWVQQMLGVEPEEEKAAETAEITPEPNNTNKLKGGSKLGRKVQGDLLPDDTLVQQIVLIPAEVSANEALYRCIGQDSVEIGRTLTL